MIHQIGIAPKKINTIANLTKEKAEKYVILIGDGMADDPLPELEGKTILESVRIPVIKRLSRLGFVGLYNPIPKSLPPGSDVAIMSILGYPPDKYYTGRGPIEAVSMGLSMGPEDVAFRCNLVTLGFRDRRIFMDDYSAGHITTEEANEIVKDLAKEINNRSFSIHAGVSYRHILLWQGGPEGLMTFPPHDFVQKDITTIWQMYEEEPLLFEIMKKAMDVLQNHPLNEKRKAEGKLPVNAIWPWGQGKKPEIPTVNELFGIKGAIVAAVDLIKGIGTLSGLEVVDVPGATGYLDTDYKAKAYAAVEAIKKNDLVIVHLEAPDEAGHMGSLKEKVNAIERFDNELVRLVTDALSDMDVSYKVLILTDHYTPINLRTHKRGAVPFLFYSNLDHEGFGLFYNEKDAANSPVLIEDGFTLFSQFIDQPVPQVFLEEEKYVEEEEPGFDED
jgi:2,3-bisphosphoglycerate-independent phosphoglycerate mutase